MKRLLAIFIILFTTLSTLPTAYGYLYNEPHSLQPQLESTRNKTLQIDVYQNYPWEQPSILYTASGSLLDDGFVLTNYHVVGEQSKFIKYVVKTYDGKLYNGKVIRYDKAKDLALMKISTEKEGFTLSTTEPYVNQSVMTVGQPAGLPRWSFSEGIILTLDMECKTSQGDLYKATQTSAQVISGNSGGPLVNDRGDLVGIIRATDDVHSYAISLDDVKEFLSEQ